MYVDFTEFDIVWSSSYATMLAAKELCIRFIKDRNALFNMARGGGAESLAGVLFEQMIINYFISGEERTFKMKYLCPDSSNGVV